MEKRNVDGGQTIKPAHNPVRPQGEQSTRVRQKGDPIPQAVWDELLEKYRTGASATDLAFEYGISRNYIYDHARRLGIRKRITVPDGTFDEPFVEPSQRVEIGAHPVHFVCGPNRWKALKRDFLAGFSAAACEDRYGVPEATIRDRAKREGWRRKDKKVEPLHPPPDESQTKKDSEGAIVSAWADNAHAAQRPPEGPWSTWLFQGGRGAGKTRAGAEWLAARAEATPRGRFALLGPTLHDVREVMIDGVSGLRNLPGRERPMYEASRRRLVWGNQAEAYAFSAEEPERLRGPQFAAAWADEFCTWPKGAYALMLLRMGLRLGDDPQLVVTTTPRPTPALRGLRAERSCVVTQAPTSQNAAHLTPTFLDGLHALYGGTRMAREELEGELLEGDGALWSRAMLDAARGAGVAKYDRVIVAVDPPAGSTGAACGIIVAARKGDCAYVLADQTAHGLSPLGWAKRAGAAAEKYAAAEIVAEANQGGEMVRATLALAGATRAVRLVYASRSKAARAGPIVALYEQGRVIHTEAFPALEEEMMALGCDDDGGRLDRADALVWALGELMLDARGAPRIRQL